MFNFFLFLSYILFVFDVHCRVFVASAVLTMRNRSEDESPSREWNPFEVEILEIHELLNFSTRRRFVHIRILEIFHLRVLQFSTFE